MNRSQIFAEIVDAFDQKYSWLGKQVSKEMLLSCLPPESKVVSKSGFIPIKDVKIGDEVLTHKGRFKKVTELFEREYSGEMIKIKTFGCPEPLCLTPDHLVFCSGIERKKHETIFLEPKWKEAKNVLLTDKILFPILDKNSKSRKLIGHNKYASIYRHKREKHVFGRLDSLQKIPFNLDFATLAGFYLAEGHIADSKYKNKKYPAVVGYSFGKSELEKKYANEVVVAAKSFNFSTKLFIKEDCFHVDIYCSGLARYFEDVFGRGASKKRIPFWMFSLSNSFSQRLLDCYLCGDGHHIKENKEIYQHENSWITTTVSQDLAYSFILLGSMLGYRVGVRKSNPSKSGFGRNRLPFYVISFNKTGLKRDCRIATKNHYTYLGIRSIEREQYAGKVYNLEVIGDNSYCHIYHAVHNCASWNIQQFSHPDYRVRRHVLLYWPPGNLKSCFLVRFANILGPDYCIKMSDVTLAALRGTVEFGKFVVPFTMKRPFGICTEFGQIISGTYDQDLLQKLLNVLEEGQVSVSLGKISTLSRAEVNRIQENYPIRFIDDNTFTYETNWVMMGATYNKKFLVDSALESRFSMVVPEQNFTPDYLKYVSQSGSFELDPVTINSFREEIVKNEPIDCNIRLPDEIFSSGVGLDKMREIGNLKSTILCHKWWGIDISDERIIEMAKRIKLNSNNIWKLDEDKVFECIQDSYKSISEIMSETKLEKKAVHTALKKLQARPMTFANGNDDDVEIRYTIK